MQQNIYFQFSLYSSGYPTIENVKSYQQNRSKYVSKCRSKLFVEAVNECDDFVNDPAVRKRNQLICLK